jgi:pectin methylesterase-like acyl-CoA thioesterase
MNRKTILLKISTLLETASDGQLVLLDKKIRELIGTKDWSDNSVAENRNFTSNGSPVFEDVEEGNYGTLYRNPSI